MHDIIISSLIRSERDRLDMGNNRLEETRPLQGVIREFFVRLFDRSEKPRQLQPGVKRRPGLTERTDCACRPAR